MTVQYSRAIINDRDPIPALFRLLFRWNGSVYKMIWPEFVIFFGIYTFLSCTYHFVLDDFQKEMFEIVAKYCNEFSHKMPLSFVLGFFVAVVMDRFWIQFDSIPWPADVAHYVTCLISGKDEEGRMLRRTIMRYICAGYVYALYSISRPLKKRFPTLDHFVIAGFFLPHEKDHFENITTNINKYIVPFAWANNLVQRARREGRIKSTLGVHTLLGVISDFRGKCGTLTNLDAVTVPIAYTQVVVLAVYVFCSACLLGRYKFDDGDETDYHIPLMTLFQFTFYMGWLKVALGGLHAFGEDDDDFECNALIDMTLNESYLIADGLHGSLPEFFEDPYWDKNVNIPYTSISLKTLKDFYNGSALDFLVPLKQQHFVLNPEEAIRNHNRQKYLRRPKRTQSK